MLSAGQTKENKTQFFSRKFIPAQDTGEQTGNMNISQRVLKYLQAQGIKTEFNRST